jgi:ribonuclease-3
MSSTEQDPSAEDGYAGLEAKLGHRFRNRRLIARALTHRSAGAAAGGSYERLEFLGDRVLGLVIADMLLTRFPEEPEGHLSRRLNAMVRGETLADVARGLDLGAEIRFGMSEAETDADNPSILADVCEALIAALFRDGGLPAARAFIEAEWARRLEADPTPPRDAKSALQEWTMARGLGFPDYEETGREGPDHAPVFTIRVSVPGHGAADASGRSKRVAEQAAAGDLLSRLQSETHDER